MTKETQAKLRSASVRRVRRVTAGLLHHRAPALSPDGRRLISACGSGADSAWVVTDRKGRVARVLEGPVEGTAAIAPDHTIAYGRQVGATSEIWMLASAGAAPQRLLGADGRLYRDPAFSPDGRLLCYSADDGSARAGARRLFLLDLIQDERTDLLAPTKTARAAGPGAPDEPRLDSPGHPSFSPDGERLFFEATGAEGPALYAVDLTPGSDGRKAQRLTGPGYRRPTALSATLLCAERDYEDGGSEIVLLELRPARGGGLRVREVALTDRSERARDPAVCAGSGKKAVPLVCWAMPGKERDGEPQRYDLYVGELTHLPHRAPRRPEPPDAEPAPPEDAPTRGDTKSGAAVFSAILAAEPARALSWAADERPVPGALPGPGSPGEHGR